MADSCSILARDLLRLEEAEVVRACRVEAFTGPGPGGTHRNRTRNAVRLVHEPSGLIGQADDTRSREQNLSLAVERLRWRVALEARLPAGPVEGPLSMRVSRRELPELAARVLDVLAECGWSLRDAAGRLGTTTGQLSTLLQRDTRLLDWVNRQRSAAGLKALRG